MSSPWLLVACHTPTWMKTCYLWLSGSVRNCIKWPVRSVFKHGIGKLCFRIQAIGSFPQPSALYMNTGEHPGRHPNLQRDLFLATQRYQQHFSSHFPRLQSLLAFIFRDKIIGKPVLSQELGLTNKGGEDMCTYIGIYAQIKNTCIMRLSVCMYACMHACMDVCMYVCMYVCVCMYACMHVCMYACMHACMYMCVYDCTFCCLNFQYVDYSICICVHVYIYAIYCNKI